MPDLHRLLDGGQDLTPFVVREGMSSGASGWELWTTAAAWAGTGPGRLDLRGFIRTEQTSPLLARVVRVG